MTKMKWTVGRFVHKLGDAIYLQYYLNFYHNQDVSSWFLCDIGSIPTLDSQSLHLEKQDANRCSLNLPLTLLIPRL